MVSPPPLQEAKSGQSETTTEKERSRPEAFSVTAESFMVDEVSVVPRQAVLRAIFGAEQEMDVTEILRQLRGLRGVRHVALAAPADVASLDALKRSLGSLGFGAANIRIFGSQNPIEFFRHSNTLLAVQTNSGFGPGMKEVFKLAVEEIDHLS